MSEKIELTHHQIKALLEMSEASGDPECYDDLVLQMGARTPTAAPACTPGIANARRKALSSSEPTPKTRRAATPLRRGAAMTDKIPLDAALRSRVADLLHLLQFARIETPTAGDAEQAEKAMNDLERMLAAPAAPAAPEPVPAAQEPVAWQARFTDPGQQWGDCTKEHHDFVKANPGEWSGYEVRELFATPPAAEQLDHSGDSADMVWCACGDGYPADTHDAGFIHGSGMCQSCDAAIPAKDIQADADDLVVWRITLPSGESCHFGTESMAKAWGRGSGKVERIDLKARPALELVAAEQPDAVKVPRELLRELADIADSMQCFDARDDAMGLLDKEGE